MTNSLLKTIRERDWLFKFLKKHPENSLYKKKINQLIIDAKSSYYNDKIAGSSIRKRWGNSKWITQ